MNPIVIIPARMASTRLPGKPLADIARRADDRARLAPGGGGKIGPVVVACAEREIAAGGRVRRRHAPS